MNYWKLQMLFQFKKLSCQPVKFKAYIPLRRKISGVRGWRWAMPPTPEFCSQRNPMQNLIFVFYPTRNPNASQWNIGCVGSLALGLCVGHELFIFLVLISFALGSRRKRSFQRNMGLRVKGPFFSLMPSLI